MDDKGFNILIGLGIFGFFAFIGMCCLADSNLKQEAIRNGCNNYGNGIIICKGELK